MRALTISHCGAADAAADRAASRAAATIEGMCMAGLRAGVTTPPASAARLPESRAVGENQPKVCRTCPSPACMALAGGCVLDRATHVLRDAAGRPIELRPQAFDVLCVLAEHRGALVSKETLFARVWPGLVVTDDSLVQAIGDIRRALGEA